MFHLIEVNTDQASTTGRGYAEANIAGLAAQRLVGHELEWKFVSLHEPTSTCPVVKVHLAQTGTTAGPRAYAIVARHHLGDALDLLTERNRRGKVVITPTTL